MGKCEFYKKQWAKFFRLCVGYEYKHAYASDICGLRNMQLVRSGRGVFTYRNEQTLRLATDAHAAKECAQCNQYANCQEHI